MSKIKTIVKESRKIVIRGGGARKSYNSGIASTHQIKKPTIYKKWILYKHY